MSDLDRNYASPFGRAAGRADAATVDAGLRSLPAQGLQLHGDRLGHHWLLPHSASTWARVTLMLLAPPAGSATPT